MPSLMIRSMRRCNGQFGSILSKRWCSTGSHNHIECTSSKSEVANEVRVRYAPSPTGYLHLGGLRTALFNYLFAKSAGGQFILRIEDTDKNRQVDGSVEALRDSLEWCGVVEDEGPTKGGPHGPYIQSERLDIYRQFADQLIEDGQAYRCFCSSERLDKLRQSQLHHGASTMYDRACLGLSASEIEEKVSRGEAHTVRMKIPPGKTVVKDLLRGYVTFEHSGIDDQVLLKSDGYPTYHLANVVDDHLMRISHVIRGEEWLPSTPKHVLLYKALGLKAPTFAHLGLLLNEDRTKLSKRQGDVAVEDFRAKGYLPSGLVNFVALLGWNPANGNNQEVFRMDELESQFTIENVNKAGSVVNPDRLNWINSRHIRSLFDDECEFLSEEDKSEVIDKVLPFLVDCINTQEVRNDVTANKLVEEYGQEYIWGALGLMKERVNVFPEFGPLCLPFFTTPDFDSDMAKEMKANYIDDSTEELLAEVRQAIEDLDGDDFTPAAITKALKKIAKQRKLGMKKVLMPVRYYLTGMDVGAGLGDTIQLLGKDVVLERLQTRS